MLTKDHQGFRSFSPSFTLLLLLCSTGAHKARNTDLRPALNSFQYEPVERDGSLQAQYGAHTAGRWSRALL